MFKKVFIFASIALLSSCVNKPHIERPSEDLLNQQISNRVESITKAAIKSEKKETDLEFGFKFGMSCKEVKSVLSKLSPEKEDNDTYYTVSIDGETYSVSIEPKYRNSKLYSLLIQFLAKNSDTPLSNRNANKIWNHYTSSNFTKRKYNTFQYSDFGDSICLAYKDNLICQLKLYSIGSLIDITFTDKSAEKEKKRNTFAGSYYCARTRDLYHFNDDATGYFKVLAGTGLTSNFTWSKVGNKVTIVFCADAFSSGKQVLKYNERERTITEKSPNFGKLKYNKQE